MRPTKLSHNADVPKPQNQDVAICFGHTPATPTERTRACERLGIFGLETESQGLAGPRPKRIVEIPKRGCRRASWNGKRWAIARALERPGTKVALADGEAVVCGSPMKLKVLARILPVPALAVGPLGKLGADLRQVTVEVVIGQDGITRLRINGIKGPACTDLAKQIKAATGLDVISDSPTSEYYEEPVVETARTGATVSVKRYSL